jgi:hypothetical protein
MRSLAFAITINANKAMKEKLDICAVCKKKTFDPNKGLICSLTNEKPTFEDECITYEADSDKIEKLKGFAIAHKDKISISGWLAFFLWVGIGVGAIASSVIGIVQIFNEGFGWLFSTIYLISIVTLVAIAIYAIIAFYRRKSNAVSLARTYIAMIVLDGVLSIVISVLLDDSSLFPQAIRQFVWAAIWFAFLQNSTNVQEIIPVQSRSWNGFEKIVLIIYIVTLCLFTASITYAAKSDNPQNLFYTSDSFIDISIAEGNKELPAIISEGITLQRISKDNKNIIYTYQLDNIYKTDTDETLLSENATVSKHELLYEFSKDTISDEFTETCFNKGYSIVYKYIDALSETLYSISISPEEYSSVLNTTYKCPTETLADLIYKYNIQLPIDYMGDASLQRILLNDSDKELIYKVRLPQLSLDNMTSLTSSYLNEYIIDNWSDLSDSIIRLAVVNQLIIRFDFITYSGLEYATIRISPETYNAIS